MEDEKATLIDLSDTLRAEGGDVPASPAREHVPSTSAEEVVITVEDEEKPEEKEEEKPAHRPFGWIRRK